MTKAKTAPQISDEREAEIQAAITRDPDSRKASDEQLARMRPASEALSPALLASLKNSIGSDLTKVDAYVNTAVDYEEIPEITDEQFARGVRHRNGVPVRGRPPLDNPKKLVSIRLDQDVLDHFRNRGPGWQSRINALLRRSMNEDDLDQVAGGG